MSFLYASKNQPSYPSFIPNLIDLINHDFKIQSYIHPLISLSVSRTQEDFIFIGKKNLDTSSYQPEKILNTLMNILAIDESNSNEIIGFFHAESDLENIRSEIEKKCYTKQIFGQGKGFFLNCYLNIDLTNLKKDYTSL